MSSGIQTVPLGEVCDVRRGTTITQKSVKPGDVPVVAGGVTPAYFHSHANRPANVITVSGSGAGAGFVNFFDVPIFASDCSTILPRDPKVLDVKYVHLFMKSQQPYIQANLRQGAAQPHVYAKDLAKIPIPLLPLEDQQRIVLFLTEAFEGLDRARANARANLQNAEDLFEASLCGMFTERRGKWRQCKLGELCEFITDGTHQTPKYFDQGYIFLSSKNVRGGRIDWDDVKYLDQAQHDRMYGRLAPRLNDLLLRKNGAGYGKAALVDRDEIFDVYVSLAVLRPLKHISPRFLLLYINSPLAMRQFNDRIKGQGVPNLHLQEIREVVVEFPTDLVLQEEIAATFEVRLTQCQVLADKYRSKLGDLIGLQQSLLQRAFAGALT